MMNADVQELAGWAVVTGVAVAAVCVPCVLIPDQAKGWIRAFPRWKWAGWLLTALDLLWAGALLSACQPFVLFCERFGGARMILSTLTPLTFVLTVLLMDELLAPRALGGFLLLAPAPLLAAARGHESGFRYVIILLAYAMVVEGIILVLSPYQFRKITERWTRGREACRVVGLVGLGFGLFVVLLGLKAF